MANKTQSTALPATGFIRLAQIIGNPRANPPIPAIIPVCRASIWNMVKQGRFPKPVKISQRTTGWRAEDIAAWIEAKSAREAAQ